MKIEYDSDSLPKGKFAESGPERTKEGLVWKVTFDFAQIGGSLKRLMATTVHEFDHGIFFIEVAKKSIERWGSLTESARDANRRYHYAINNHLSPSMVRVYYNQYKNSAVESRAFSTQDILWKEQGW
jgi:hypothetical protein